MNPHIRFLNEHLKAELGANRHGEPLYRWMHTRELLFPVYGEKKIKWAQSAGGIFLPEEVSRPVRYLRQKLQDCWAVGAWEEYTPGRWMASLGDTSPYPDKGGIYFITDFPTMPPGEEPTEAVTEVLIRRVKAKRDAIHTEKDAHRVLYDNIINPHEAQQRADEEDWLRECAVHNPNVSLCGLEVPR